MDAKLASSEVGKAGGEKVQFFIKKKKKKNDKCPGEICAPMEG